MEEITREPNPEEKDELLQDLLEKFEYVKEENEAAYNAWKDIRGAKTSIENAIAEMLKEKSAKVCFNRQGKRFSLYETNEYDTSPEILFELKDHVPGHIWEAIYEGEEIKHKFNTSALKQARKIGGRAAEIIDSGMFVKNTKISISVKEAQN